MRLSVIMELPMPDASLAKGVDNAEDEVMNLNASMLFAGFRGSVATMW
jgi:hypothetical protein